MAETTQKPMNIYQKLQKVRRLLSEKGLAKTGLNKHTNAKYFEIGDFLPEVVRLCDDHGLFTQFNIYLEGEQEWAALIVYNADNPTETISFKSPTAAVALQGGQAIQNLGGKHTYMRRYLLIEAFEIAESDAVDAQAPKENVPVDEVTDDLIKSAQTKEELRKICAELNEKYPKQREAIVSAYTKRKAELDKIEKKTEGPKIGEVQQSPAPLDA